ncbi:uncharacterized protein CBL_04247 [Carabus blaptoides fortunei]
MSLVSYEYSDSDEENEEDCENGKVEVNNKNNNGDSALSEEKIKKIAKKEPVKITIPALSGYNSDEADTPKKIAKAPVKATGLFAVLPAPKCKLPEKNAKFDAKVVTLKNLVPRSVKNNKHDKKQVDSDDEDVKEGDHFFSSIFTDNKFTPITTSSVLNNVPVNCAVPVQEELSKTNQFFADLVSNSAKVEDENEETDTLDENAIKELCGKRRKGNNGEDIRVIDINADDVMPDSRDWQTKALTEETPTAVNKGEEPSQQSRRKHQITYLAYQAKVNEQDLKNQWALNRMTRKQTQAKYGF